MEHLHQALFEWVQAHGMVGVYLFMVLENAGIPVPTEVGFVVAQLLINSGRIGYPGAWAVIVSGHVSGACLSYYLGRAGDNVLARRFANSRRMMEARERMQKWFDRHGALAVLFGRLVGQVRPWASFIAGMANVKPSVFVLWTVVGSCVYTAVVMALTRWGWGLWERYPHLRVTGVVVLMTIFYGAAVVALLVELYRRLRRRSRST